MKKLIFIILTVLFLFSCKSMDEIVVESISDEDYRKIDSVDLLILRYKIEKSPDLLTQIKSDVKDLERKHRNNKKYEAVILGIYGEIELLENNTAALKNTLDGIVRKNPNEERYFLLSAQLENDPVKKEALIRSGIEKADSNMKLKLFLADLYFLNGDFTKATGLYDDALGLLPEDYKLFYKKRRDVSYQFIKNAPQKKDSIELILKNEISVSDLIRLSVYELLILSGYQADMKANISPLFEKLKTDSFFYHSLFPTLKPESKVQRKDIAFFALKVISLIENNPQLIRKYNREFADSRAKTNEIFNISPVPDINPADYYYTAVLILVERELMELPDGVNFQPQNTFSGEETFELIRKINKMKKK